MSTLLLETMPKETMPGDDDAPEPDTAPKKVSFDAEGEAARLIRETKRLNIEHKELLNELLERYGLEVLGDLVEKRRRLEKAILGTKRVGPSGPGKGK